MRTCSAAEIEAFLYGEARALDDHDWDTWLTFYSPDVCFWVPAWDDNDRLIENPQTEISLIYYPDRGGLANWPRSFMIFVHSNNGLPLA
jgi:benzoate/toluate 1,2-dioxygenase subunit beta